MAESGSSSGETWKQEDDIEILIKKKRSTSKREYQKARTKKSRAKKQEAIEYEGLDACVKTFDEFVTKSESLSAPKKKLVSEIFQRGFEHSSSSQQDHAREVMRDNDIASVYMNWVENPGNGKPAELTVLNHQNYFVMLCRVIDKHNDWVKKRVRFIVS